MLHTAADPVKTCEPARYLAVHTVLQYICIYTPFIEVKTYIFKTSTYNQQFGTYRGFNHDLGLF